MWSCLFWDPCYHTSVTFPFYGKFAGVVDSTVDPKLNVALMSAACYKGLGSSVMRALASKLRGPGFKSRQVQWVARSL